MTLNGDVETFAGSSETALSNVALERPNGAAISPDGRQLYIGESDSGRIRVVSKE